MVIKAGVIEAGTLWVDSRTGVARGTKNRIDLMFLRALCEQLENWHGLGPRGTALPL
jgi:hypothetical protein